MRPTILKWTAAALLLGSACATTDPIALWRDRVTRYVVRQGNGDLGVLRDLVDAQPRTSLTPSRVTFNEFGVPAARGFQDVYGLLLGARELQGRVWYVFLVRVAPAGQDLDGEDSVVHLAAVSAETGALHWAIGRAHSPALRPQPPSDLDDPTDTTSTHSTLAVSSNGLTEYGLTTMGHTLVVTDEKTGERWELNIENAY